MEERLADSASAKALGKCFLESYDNKYLLHALGPLSATLARLRVDAEWQRRREVLWKLTEIAVDLLCLQVGNA